MMRTQTIRPRRVGRKTPYMLEEAERKRVVKEQIRNKKNSKLSDEQLSQITEEKRKQKEQIAARLLLLEEQRHRIQEERREPRKDSPIVRSISNVKFSLVDLLKSECVLDRDYCFPPR